VAGDRFDKRPVRDQSGCPRRFSPLGALVIRPLSTAARVMAYPTIMVHVGFDAATEARLRLATGLADRFESALIGIAACAPHPPFEPAGVAIVPLSIQDNLDELTNALDQQQHRFRSITANGSRRVEWRSALEPPTEFIVRESYTADLIIIGSEHLPRDPFQSLDPGALVLRVGRPVLMVPNRLDGLRANRIAVAWKDTREARRALSDSLPFLHDAERVFLVEVCAKHEAESVRYGLNDVMNYLTRHHITTTAAVALQAASVTDELLRVVRTENIDLLVAGAYGHSRLGEWVFGGVTRELLHKSPVCCLFSH
jgi:nucleotide-binding universal stress UspA family protein